VPSFVAAEELPGISRGTRGPLPSGNIGTDPAYLNYAGFHGIGWIDSTRLERHLAMTVTLESLQLDEAQLQACKEAVRKLAYFKWLEAGCPQHSELEFWVQAERDWIAHCYVPRRAPEQSHAESGGSPPCGRPPAPQRKNAKRSARANVKIG
jgi:hypothetical protein